MPRKSTTTRKPQLNLSFNDEAIALLHEFAPTRKSYGAFLERLLFEERARREGRIEGRLEERQRLLDLYDKNGTQN